MNEYIALAPGYTDHYIREGEHFFYSGKKPSWAKCVNPPHKKKEVTPADKAGGKPEGK